MRHKISHRHKRYVLRENSRACTRLLGLKKIGSGQAGNMPADGCDVPSVRILLVLAAG